MAPPEAEEDDPGETRDGAHQHQHGDARPVDRDARQPRRIWVAAHRLHPVAEPGVLEQDVDHDGEDQERDGDLGMTSNSL